MDVPYFKALSLAEGITKVSKTSATITCLWAAIRSRHPPRQQTVTLRPT